MLDWDRMRGPYPGSMVLTAASNADNNIQQSKKRSTARIVIVVLVIMILTLDVWDSSGFFTPAISNSCPGY